MIPTSVRIFVCTQPLDMRRSFDGLAAAAKQMLGEDPRSGALFVFTNRRSNRLKVLWWDKNGYCMLCKRLHQALFRLPSTHAPSDRSVIVDGRGLHELLRGVASAPRQRQARDRS
ncbi:IS66 family insertion sequence element accessory protein TnpB [Nannocystis sp. SCPEA4]|uniref:IS66 family insertion sequence element accessory protein TnpB n=1 Tax=Nannocystis sp. SCPEA4 TaxID=2996787 RepID=UPI0022712C91|nr:IS66 family insertion sequence element accessory protein TnpB [Nannocystis sp. SCPEA4]MCY1056219.1 IS66 family insertion sequence element accessory protein TnpB [Nannocystis sp. SCPEA4]